MFENQIRILTWEEMERLYNLGKGLSYPFEEVGETETDMSFTDFVALIHGLDRVAPEMLLDRDD